MGNYYRLLGLRKDATDDEIKEAYRKLALASNPKRQRPRPNLTPSEHAQEQMMRQQAEELESLQIFSLTAEAYDVLSDPLRKAIFDQFGEKALKEGIPGPGGFINPYAYHGDPFRTFREFFGTENPFADLLAASCAPSDQGSSMDGFRPKDAPVYKPLPLTLEEVYTGAIKKLIINKKVMRKDGSVENKDKVLTVVVPPGAPHGMQFNFPSEGDQGPKLQPADILFQAEIQRHPVFDREGSNLVMVHKITLYEALCGGPIPVQTLDGRRFNVYNVHMIQPGYEKVVKGEGMPLLGDPGTKGDLIIRFKVKYPSKLTDEQKKHLRIALDPQKQTGKSPYDRVPPATFTVAERCICPEESATALNQGRNSIPT